MNKIIAREAPTVTQMLKFIQQMLTRCFLIDYQIIIKINLVYEILFSAINGLFITFVDTILHVVLYVFLNGTLLTL